MITKLRFEKIKAMMERETKTYKIFHSGDIGDQSVYVEAHSGIDVIRAAVYCQFASEIYYRVTALLTNLGIASALVTFYGCQHTAKTADATPVDMHIECAKRSGPKWKKLMADKSLARKGLRTYLKPHIHIDNWEEMNKKRKKMAKTL